MEQMSLESILANLGVEPRKVRENFPDKYKSFLHVLVETAPERAYEAFRDAEDKEGLSEARRRLVETAPEIAYRAFRDAEDKEGLRALATFIASQTGADTERLEKLFSDS